MSQFSRKPTGNPTVPDPRLHRLARVSDPAGSAWLGRETGHNACRRGVSLMEVMLVLVVIGILISMSAPTFHRSIEQSWADIAGANLRAIWSAERIYWLEYRTYTGDLSELESLGLLDPTIIAGTARYAYAISAADDSSFTATATRTGSVRWTGQLTIDESGVSGGAIQAAGQPDVVPGFQ
ncbi:MAG: type IV pilin protein [Planctomycetota bacterium]|jgi:type IV pilus assembly protein PilE